MRHSYLYEMLTKYKSEVCKEHLALPISHEIYLKTRGFMFLAAAHPHYTSWLPVYLCFSSDLSMTRITNFHLPQSSVESHKHGWRSAQFATLKICHGNRISQYDLQSIKGTCLVYTVTLPGSSIIMTTKKDPIICDIDFISDYIFLCYYIGARSSVVVKALRHKLEGHGFKNWWDEWTFSI
jgi:hypothetical protein